MVELLLKNGKAKMEREELAAHSATETAVRTAVGCDDAHEDVVKRLKDFAACAKSMSDGGARRKFPGGKAYKLHAIDTDFMCMVPSPIGRALQAARLERRGKVADYTIRDLLLEYGICVR